MSINNNINNLINELEVPTGLKVAAVGYAVSGGNPLGAAAAYGLYKAYNELKVKYNQAKDAVSKQNIKVQMDRVQDEIKASKEKK